MTKQIYRVSFFKTLTDSTGHPVDACQGVIEVRAPTKDRAIRLAENAFANSKDVLRWSLRADYETVERLAYRPRGSMCRAERADSQIPAMVDARRGRWTDSCHS